jgi:hypothetical protein
VLILSAFSTTPTSADHFVPAQRRPLDRCAASLWAERVLRGRIKKRYFYATSMAVWLALCPCKAHAADEQRQAWRVTGGTPRVLARYYEIQGSDCRAMRAPPVAITTRPVLGKLVVNTISELATQPAKCRHVKVPVTQVVYHPDASGGQDVVGWRVYFQSRELGTRSVQGTVTIGPGTPSRPMPAR